MGKRWRRRRRVHGRGCLLPRGFSPWIMSNTARHSHPLPPPPRGCSCYESLHLCIELLPVRASWSPTLFLPADSPAHIRHQLTNFWRWVKIHSDDLLLIWAILLIVCWKRKRNIGDSESVVQLVSALSCSWLSSCCCEVTFFLPFSRDPSRRSGDLSAVGGDDWFDFCLSTCAVYEHQKAAMWCCNRSAESLLRRWPRFCAFHGTRES